jgi:hypothetical protein
MSEQQYETPAVEPEQDDGDFADGYAQAVDDFDFGYDAEVDPALYGVTGGELGGVQSDEHAPGYDPATDLSLAAGMDDPEQEPQEWQPSPEEEQVIAEGHEVLAGFLQQAHGELGAFDDELALNAAVEAFTLLDQQFGDQEGVDPAQLAEYAVAIGAAEAQRMDKGSHFATRMAELEVRRHGLEIDPHLLANLAGEILADLPSSELQDLPAAARDAVEAAGKMLNPGAEWRGGITARDVAAYHSEKAALIEEQARLGEAPPSNRPSASSPAVNQVVDAHSNRARQVRR